MGRKKNKEKKEEKARLRLARKLAKTNQQLEKSSDSEVTREALAMRAEKLERKLEKARQTNEKVHGKRTGGGSERIFEYTQNREVSWLRFDDRVLDEAFDETVPLFERLKFVSIFGSNLDEWFMVRIGGLSDLALLKHQPRDSRSGETPSQQIETVLAMLPALIERQGQVFSSIEANLAGSGLTRVAPSDLTDADLNRIAQFFDARIAPIISPMIIDPRHPFPNLKNGRLYVACSLDGPEETGMLGIVEVPHSLDRVVPLPSTPRNYRYILLEDLMLFRLSDCFGDYEPTSSAIIRVTRNADIDPDGDGLEEDEDYRQHMRQILRERLRLQAVRLEIGGSLPTALENFLSDSMHLTPNRVFHTNMPLDLGYVYGLEGCIPDISRTRLLFDPFEPQPSPMVDPARPMLEQVEDHDILLCYPYESMNPLLRLLKEASSDDRCISIKITLYRIAKQSKLCESLIAAVENGKEVTVLMELRARFDEANNIAWAGRLEDAGCTVIYGSEGFKVHSKICQITYHDGGHIKRITCLGTGNFNEKTARLYSDFMLLTAHEQIGEDGNTFFRNLSLGNLRGTYRHLGVAPVGLKPLVMRGLNREIERARSGEDAQVFMKMNSLTDRDVIDKIAEACAAGVRVVLIIRGICCIRANVKGYTEGLMVRQIVGRFLEHTRIYAFGTQADTIYLSSADMMTRNTEHRVEIAYPVLDDTCRRLVVQFINIQLADNAKARELTEEGTWSIVEPEPGEPTINAQELLLSLAYRRARGELAEGSELLFTDGIRADLPLKLMRKLASLPSMAHLDTDAPGEEVDAQDDKGSDVTTAPQPEQPQVSHVEAHVIEDTPKAEELQDEVEEFATQPHEATSDNTTAVADTPDASVEPEEPFAESIKGTPKPEPDEQSSSTAIERRTPGRVKVALKLIGMGVRELFTGRISRNAKQRRR
ncbi:MAG: polyphosphate kinase 1 [Atopobiaceae bacterium]|nr:polyphosphate kinase 1 [Atopobiaceae bacterium]